jgi:hypothetical protein
MLKRLLSGVAELALGIAMAGLVLALVIPLLLKSGIISTGDRLGSVLIALILATGAGIAVLRPGGMLNRRNK